MPASAIQWKRSFLCSFLAQVLSTVGFSFALPFLPFFIKELGVNDPARQAWWAGVALGTSGLTLVLSAPVWGGLADRFGRKAMVMRAMFGGTVVLLLMSYSRNIGDLLICRLLQGAFTGTLAASIALVASFTPSKRTGLALGMMQSAVFLGTAIGPLIGGIVADRYGYRPAFRAGAVLTLLGGLLVRYGAQEAFVPPTPEEQKASSFRALLKNSSLSFAILFLLGIRFANTIINPSFPLVISNILESPERLNSVTGMVMAISGLAGAVAAATLGYVGDKLGHHRVLIACTLGAAVSAAFHALARSIFELTIANLFFGMTISGILPAVSTIIQGAIDQQQIGKAFGIASSISMIGLAIGPFAGGYIASEYGIRVPFIAAAICQTGMALLMVRAHRVRSVWLVGEAP